MGVPASSTSSLENSTRKDESEKNRDRDDNNTSKEIKLLLQTTSNQKTPLLLPPPTPGATFSTLDHLPFAAFLHKLRVPSSDDVASTVPVAFHATRHTGEEVLISMGSPSRSKGPLGVELRLSL